MPIDISDDDKRSPPAPTILHAVQLEEKQWTDVFKGSGVFKAWVGEVQGDRIVIKRAKKPVFALKTNKPEFDVEDDSHITSQQTSSRVESELSLKGFSEWGVHAALAGGAHGLTLGLSGDIGQQRQTTSMSKSVFEATTIHCSYNFPRVVVHFRTETLTLSNACITSLVDLRKKLPNPPTKDHFKFTDADLKDFFETFGGVFAREVCLGGRLYSTSSIFTNDKTKILDRKNEMKKCLTANFMSPFVGAGVGYDRVAGDEITRLAKTSAGSEGISIEAHGGNSVVSWSPQQWAKSVEPYHYWRAIKQDNVVDLITYLSEGFKDSKSGNIDLAPTIERLKYTYDAKIQAEREAEQHTFILRLGHTCRELTIYERRGRCSYKWTFWIWLSRTDRMVKGVHIVLHDTFNTKDIYFGRKEFHKDCHKLKSKMTVTRDGWGEFKVCVYIELADGWRWRDKQQVGEPTEHAWASSQFTRWWNLTVGSHIDLVSNDIELDVDPPSTGSPIVRNEDAPRNRRKPPKLSKR